MSLLRALWRTSGTGLVLIPVTRVFPWGVIVMHGRVKPVEDTWGWETRLEYIGTDGIKTKAGPYGSYHEDLEVALAEAEATLDSAVAAGWKPTRTAA